MTKTILKPAHDLLASIRQSSVVPTLVSSYRNALEKLADSDQFALKRTLQTILKQEKTNDLQSLYFTEETLEKFVEEHLKITTPAEKLKVEFRDKAEKLVRTFLFFDAEQKNQIIPALNTFPLEGLKKFINLMHEGHRKQSEYLDVFVEKDPKTAIKFEVIASGSFEKANTKTTTQK